MILGATIVAENAGDQFNKMKLTRTNRSILNLLRKWNVGGSRNTDRSRRSYTFSRGLPQHSNRGP